MRRRRIVPAFPVLLLAGLTMAQAVSAQSPSLPPTAIPQTKADAGQDVVPSFDGWIHNKDGTYTFVFGYMNRNYKEELAIPAGPDNKVENLPSGTAPDQGQPTYFMPRRHAWVYLVKVPADWSPQKEVIWTINSHGRTEKAYASLQLEWEIEPRTIQSRGNLSPGFEDPNRPPEISLQPVTQVRVGDAVALTALVTDDGLPKPRAPKPAPPPDAKGLPTAQTNSAGGRPRLGLNVSWLEYRGPAKAVFAQPSGIIVTDGKAVTTARFTVPGTYVLRATADDGELVTPADITINVTAN